MCTCPAKGSAPTEPERGRPLTWRAEPTPSPESTESPDTPECPSNPVEDMRLPVARCGRLGKRGCLRDGLARWPGVGRLGCFGGVGPPMLKTVCRLPPLGGLGDPSSRSCRELCREGCMRGVPRTCPGAGGGRRRDGAAGFGHGSSKAAGCNVGCPKPASKRSCCAEDFQACQGLIPIRDEWLWPCALEGLAACFDKRPARGFTWVILSVRLVSSNAPQPFLPEQSCVFSSCILKRSPSVSEAETLQF
jgi:hypothetical protein